MSEENKQEWRNYQKTNVAGCEAVEEAAEKCITAGKKAESVGKECQAAVDAGNLKEAHRLCQEVKQLAKEVKEHADTVKAEADKVKKKRTDGDNN